MQLKKMIVVVGHYGSGKTEFSLNLAFDRRKAGDQVTIVDLDVVNPYFRTSDQREKLTEAGIQVIVPVYAGTNADVPALPPEVYAAFEKEGTVIFDVGGDDDGATVLGRFYENFKGKDFEVLAVVNPKRPFQESPTEIIEGLRAIEAASRLGITDIIANPNLSYETNGDVVLQGLPIIRSAADAMGLSIKCVCTTPKVDIDSEYELFIIDNYVYQPNY